MIPDRHGVKEYGGNVGKLELMHRMDTRRALSLPTLGLSSKWKPEGMNDIHDLCLRPPTYIL
jgi:hypothetical protein